MVVKSRVVEQRPTLNVSIDPHLYRKLKSEIGDRKVSRFVERAIAKELGEYDWGLEQKQKEFQQKLIAGYKRSAQSKALKKEDKIWDEAIGDGIE